MTRTNRHPVPPARGGVALPMALLALAVIGGLLAAVSAISLHESRVGAARHSAEAALAGAESAVLDALAEWDVRDALARPAGSGWGAGPAAVLSLGGGRWWVVGEGRAGGARRRVGVIVRLALELPHPAAFLAAGPVEAAPGGRITADGEGCEGMPAPPLPPALAVRLAADAAGARAAVDADAVVEEPGDSVWRAAGALAEALARRAVPIAGGENPPPGSIVHAPGALTIPSGARWSGAVVADGPLVLERWAVVTGMVVARGGLVLEEGARVEGRVVVLGGSARLEAGAEVVGEACAALDGALLAARAVPAGARGWVDVW